MEVTELVFHSTRQVNPAREWRGRADAWVAAVKRAEVVRGYLEEIVNEALTDLVASGEFEVVGVDPDTGEAIYSRRLTIAEGAE